MTLTLERQAEAGTLPVIGHHIGGRAVEGEGRTGPVFHPASGAVAARVALASRAVVDEAVAGAAAAFPGWAATPAHVRARVLFRFRDLVERHVDTLAALINREHGKVLADARGEVQRGLEVVEFACAAPHLLKGDYSENVGRGVDSVVAVTMNFGFSRACRAVVSGLDEQVRGTLQPLVEGCPCSRASCP